MSNADLLTVIGRAKSDPGLRDRLFLRFAQTIQEEGYQLSDGEIEEAKKALGDAAPAGPPPGAGPPGTPPMGATAAPNIMLEHLAFEAKIGKQRLEHQLKRFTDLSDYTVTVLKGTISSATSTYKTITWMNVIMFGVGIGLFLFAALYAAFATEKSYALIFGGLGTATFISLFLLKPMETSQNALSNLVQVEISFMTYFEQATFWEGYALIPQGNPPALSPANIEKASEMLQKRSMETIEMLQKYIEIESKSSSKNETVPN